MLFNPYKKIQEAFDTVKRVVSREVLLAYPNFNKPFKIYTDASKYQLGAVILQDNKPIAFYSRKLNSAQLNYTTIERELLAIVETLKEFRNIFLGQQIIVYTDHKNLTYKVFNTERVISWRLIVGEYGPQLRYLQGHKNIVADALSRLHLTPKLVLESDLSILHQPSSRLMCEAFGINKKQAKNSIAPSIPICYSTILAAQQQDKILQKKVLQPSTKYRLRSFHGGENKNFQLICYNDKIYVPTTMQKRRCL